MSHLLLREEDSTIPPRWLQTAERMIVREEGKSPQTPGEVARAGTIIPLFLLPFTLLEVMASSTSGDQHFCEIVMLCGPPPHQDWGRARRLVAASLSHSPVMTKSWGPSWGKQLP